MLYDIAMGQIISNQIPTKLTITDEKCKETYAANLYPILQHFLAINEYCSM